jgi:hypothetical protein
VREPERHPDNPTTWGNAAARYLGV